jgi:hypothetical protein
MDRSSRIEVRNPILTLPSAHKLLALPPEQRDLLRSLLRELHADCTARADKCWRTHKAPMAAYWKAAAVYAGHIARAIGR